MLFIFCPRFTKLLLLVASFLDETFFSFALLFFLETGADMSICLCTGVIFYLPVIVLFFQHGHLALKLYTDLFLKAHLAD